MRERRYVVELTKPVAASSLPAAALHIAGRLGLEVPRVVTLLQGRVGPVTKPVLAPKADAIAAVFQEAGLDVAVYDASAAPDETHWDTEVRPPAAEPPAQTREAVEPEEAPAEDEPPVRFEEPEPPAPAGALPAEPSAGDYEFDPAPTLADLDRWDVDDPWGGQDPWRQSAYEPRSTEVEVDDVTVVAAPRPAPAEPREGSARAAVSRLVSEVGGDSHDAREVPLATRQVGEDLPLPPAPGAVKVRSGLWEAGRGEVGGRRPLRGVLLVALGVALVLLLALQLLYGARDGRTGPTYEDGLQAYRAGEFTVARRIWERSAEDGSVRSGYMLGYLAQHGLGRPWSFREAAERYRVAAEAGLADAQLALGELYLEGLGVEPDAGVGAEWVRRAAEAGQRQALQRYGELLLHGVGVAQDFDAALGSFASAAERGSERAADYLALADHLRSTAFLSGP